MPEPLIIYRDTDRDGATYALSAESARRIREVFPGVHIPPRIFVAHETRQDYGTILGSMRGQIVLLLTGLSEAQLARLGQVRFQDPESEQDLGGWIPAHP
jgi:hypothetical protein